MRTKKPLRELGIPELERRLIRLKQSKEKVEVLIALGSLLKHIDTQRAIALTMQGLEIATQISFVSGIADCSAYLANYYDALIGNTVLALHYAETALGLYSKSDDKRGIAWMLKVLGSIADENREFDKAAKYFGDSMEIYRNINLPEYESTIHTSLGNMYLNMGEYGKAIDEHNIALKIHQDNNDEEGVSIALNNIGNVYDCMGESVKAVEVHLKSMSIKARRNDTYGLAATNNNLGGLYWKMGDYESAIRYFQKSYMLKIQLGNELGAADTMSNIGGTQIYLKLYEDGLHSFYSALETYENLGNTHRVAMMHNHIGSVHVLLGNIEQGFAQLQQGLEIRKELNDMYGIASSYHNLAESYSIIQEHDKGIDYISKAIDVRNTLNAHDRLPEHYTLLADILLKSHKYNEAIIACQEVLKYTPQMSSSEQEAKAHMLLSIAYEYLGDLSNAIIHLKKHQELNNRVFNRQAAMKYQTLLIEFDVELNKKEAEMNKLKSEQLAKELTMKNNELTALALHLVNKNEFLVDLREQITDNIENTNDVVKSIAKRISESEHDESDWHRFEQQFTQVHPDFSKKLMEQSGGTLTTTELKICALIKTGLSSKEIANIMFLSKRTVENHRYSIHRKLQLGDVKLANALMNT
ncbi:MAG: tetratricopeptide repeat protein [Candidatus Kapabacteria bacterium]|nr:tetratricopeptide repeat protein [Candidatus Kapabacteria bacterium]